MTEETRIRLVLAKQFVEAGNYQSLSMAYNFVSKNSRKEEQLYTSNGDNETPYTDAPDGVSIVLKDGAVVPTAGSFIPFDEIAGIGEFEKPALDTVAGIGIKWGERRLMVALQDFADGKDITLTKKKGNANDTSAYINNYLDAVADWSGRANTRRLEKQGLNPAIKLQPDWWIPSLGELYFIFTNLKAVNEALRFIGAGPIKQELYWASTEGSAANAWYLYLFDGYAIYGTKATFKRRVRPVSAFIS